MQRVPREAEEQFGAFTTTQATACGWTTKTLFDAERRGNLVRLRRGVYALSEVTEGDHPSARRDVLQRAVAAALAVPSATVSHGSAAIAYGLPMLTTPTLPCLSVARDHTTIASVHLHRRASTASHRRLLGLVPVTDVARTCVDVTRESGLLAGLVTTDAALHRGMIRPSDLDEEYRLLRGRAGLRHGRRLLELCSTLSESPLETVSRFHMDGLVAQPRQQVDLFTSTGQFLGRADFFWDRHGLVGEADGRDKYDDLELYREKLRQDGMLNAGLLVTRWGWSTAMSPRRLTEQLNRELARAGQLRDEGYEVTAVAA